MKKFLAVLLAVCLLLSLSVTALAFSDADIATSENGKTLGQIMNRMSPQEQAEAGLVPPNLKGRTYTNQLAINSTAANLTVYTTATSTTSKGFISPRERVFINSVSGSRFNIKFINNGSTDTGWVNQAGITNPSYGFTPPVEVANINYDFGVGGHAGIDVDCANASLKAIKSGDYTYTVTTKVIDGVLHTVNYGNYVTTPFTSLDGVKQTAIYAHLSSFSGGYVASTAPKYYGVQSSTTTTKNTLGTKYFSQKSIIGTSGNSGNTSGSATRGYHLHFEVQAGNKSTDPFLYVIFPNIGY